MKLRPLIAVTALAALGSSPAAGQSYTIMSGKDLAERCLVDQSDPRQLASFSFCIGYIRATFERLWIAKVEAGGLPQDCLPEDLSNRQIIDAVIADMQDYPPGDDVLASQLVREVMIAMNPGCFG